MKKINWNEIKKDTDLEKAFDNYIYNFVHIFEIIISKSALIIFIGISLVVITFFIAGIMGLIL